MASDNFYSKLLTPFYDKRVSEPRVRQFAAFIHGEKKHQKRAAIVLPASHHTLRLVTGSPSRIFEPSVAEFTTLISRTRCVGLRT